ncbi:uncharacterized protein LOC125499697 [Athalia rosae]|uniref:uncharacterized protein LOC125499697 n=1 Tax=Athalia rosae TaxID=37344 RepID=UPI0020345F75|nr:uncharacterized protein LOC125499697 [Athalia rosae]
MKFIWIYILSCAVVIVTSAPTPGEEPSNSKAADEKPEEETRRETLEDIVDLGNEETDLPILPPIILIDFTNGTNLTSEEKSKRTINGNLGYGFQGNNLFTGKYNYYFPAGKTGTTVSIEESISPFLPTTIIEKIPPSPNNNKFYVNGNANSYPGSVQNNLFAGGSNGQSQSQIRLNNAPSSAYGQRTKLQKTPGDGSRPYTSFSVTPKPNYTGYSTPKPTDFRSNQFASSGLSLGSYANPVSNYQSFTTARPIYNSPVQVRYQPGTNVKTYFGTPGKGYEGFATTRAPPAHNPTSPGSELGRYDNQRPGLEGYSNPKESRTTVLSALQGNTPKYSYEDGIKYEHKIVWKYPDGVVSEVGPNSYDSSYQEFTSPTKASLQTSNAGSAGANNFPKTLNSGYSVNAGSIYSQRPATFPDDGASVNAESKANQFVSSASISNGGNYFSGSGSQGVPPSQKYSFQVASYSGNGDVRSGKPQNGQLQASSVSYKANPSDQTSKYLPSPVVEDPKIVSNYPVDSPEPEYPPLDGYSTAEAYDRAQSSRTNSYAYTQSSSIPSGYGQTSASSSNSGNSGGGKISPEMLTKYTPQVQQYLKKALGLDGGVQRQEYQPSNLQDYSNIRYSNLLDYNPSISQYIRNPSSILNARPTFVQAGNSLIPVIILRVDGVAPIQPKVTPNINLKALLQRYLTQYARTVNNLSHGGNFEQSYAPPKGQSDPNSEHLDFDLAQLTQSLSQLRRVPNFKQNFAQNFAQSVAQSAQGYQSASYSGQSDYGDYKNQEFGSRDLAYPTLVSRDAKKPKVKNVEIIDDPRFTTYKVKN